MSKILVKRKNKTSGLYEYRNRGKLHSLLYSGKGWQKKADTLATECHIDWDTEQLKILNCDGTTHIFHVSMLEPLSILLSKMRKGE